MPVRRESGDDADEHGMLICSRYCVGCIGARMVCQEDKQYSMVNKSVAVYNTTAPGIVRRAMSRADASSIRCLRLFC